jgi:PAS domain S-box-containing protein
MTTDPVGLITDVNQQMEALTGHTREELIGTAFKGYFTEPDRAEDGIRLVLQDGKVTNYELTARAKDGRETVVSYNASTFHDGEGRLQGVFAAARDVTERKVFEEQLKDTNVELEAANFAKDRFLASMSHELRTPLNAILGFTGTLLMRLPGELNEEQQRQLKTVEQNGRHLLSIINDLLDLAKIESGNIELRFERVSPLEVVDDVVEGLRPLADENELALEVQVDPDLVLRSDRRALTQILINLTNNAIKFTETGGVRIDVEGPTAERRSISFTVTDTGIGIRAEDQERLFAAFQQIESSATRRYEGTGLGLYISQKLASLLGGSITFASTPGEGSAFTLTIDEPQ